MTCPVCAKPQGSNASCYSCRDAAARELAKDARDITDASLAAATKGARAFTDRPPWYARLAPERLRIRVRLLGMIVGDYVSGRYRKLPWRSVALCAAAIAYVISPFDLVPDWLVPIGWTDDLLVLSLAWGMVKKELREYCAWKRISPAHFGL